MSTKLLTYKGDTNAWMAFNNYFHAQQEYIEVAVNGSNPPTVLQNVRFKFYNTASGTIPSGTATGNNEYGAGDTITYLVNQAIFEDSAARTFAWSSGNFPAASDGTWYLFCDGSTDTSSASIGQGSYGASKTETPTWSFQKGGWYSASGYRILAQFTYTGGTVAITKTYTNEISKDVSGDVYIKNHTSNKDIIFKVNDGGTNTEVMRIDGGSSIVGIGQPSQTLKLEVYADSSSFDTSWRSNEAGLAVLSDDASVNIISSDSLTWGSLITLKQMDLSEGTQFENSWGIARETNGDGTGTGAFHIKYGTNTNTILNDTYLQITTGGAVTIQETLAVTGGVRTKNSTANVSNPPTDAELDSAFGTPATVGAGFLGTLDDAGGGANFYLVASDGTNWWHFTGTKAV
jgi:hypothetical protein